MFHKTAYFRADKSFLVLFVLSNFFILKLKIHLCKDAISLTCLVSSSELNCLCNYLLLRSADTSSIQILIILFIWIDRCNPKNPLHDPSDIHYSPYLLSYKMMEHKQNEYSAVRVVNLIENACFCLLKLLKKSLLPISNQPISNRKCECRIAILEYLCICIDARISCS